MSKHRRNGDGLHSVRRARLVAAALFVSLFLLWGSCFNTFGVFFLPLVNEFHVTHASVSLLSTILVLLSGAIAPLSGWLLERVGTKLVMSAGALLAGVALLGISAADSFTRLALCYVVLGIGLGASTWLPASIVITNWYRSRPGTALGIITAGMELGGMLMTLLAAHEIQVAGWRIAYLILAIPIFVIVVPVILAVVELAPGRDREADNQANGSGIAAAEAVRTISFWLAAAALFAYGLGVGGSFVHLVPYLGNAGYSEREASFALSLALGLMVVGKPVMGILGDRFGGRQTLTLGWIIFGGSTLMMLEARQVQLLVAAICLYGMTLATAIALLPVVLKDLFGLRSLGTLMGWLILFQTLGVAVGPILSGRLFDLTGGYTESFAISGGLIFIAAAAMFSCDRRATQQDLHAQPRYVV